MIACRISEATTVRSRLAVGVGEQALERRSLGEEEAVGLVVGAVDRHADVVQQGAAGDDDLGVARRDIPWSVTIAGSTPALTSSRSSRRAMLRTIWMWTQEWSDIPSRSAWTWAMYHQARTCSSALTPSRKPSSLRLPRVGARTWASAIASLGGFRAGPFGSGVGTASLIVRIVREGPGATRTLP